jgi:putative membrane protein insertion efficiency factor
MIARLARLAGRAASAPVIGLILAYQWTLSPLLGPACRFEPSCSRYMVGAIRKYGLIRGLGKGLARIGRCHPWHPGGYDPP